MMNLMYKGTRGSNNYVSASRAIVNGIAEDGGLYVPEYIPKIDFDISDLSSMSYHTLAYEVLKLLLDDFTKAELTACINKAYDSKFNTPEIAPLKKVGNDFFLELFHGKTLAFKDMALSILPHLLTTAAKKNNVNKELVILTATSGDTGKAALEGFADVEGVQIIVFYPQDGVSPVQKAQMVTQTGANTIVAAIRGNFDDAQSAVKKVFTNDALKKELFNKGYVFSSANSINIGRLAPQIVYYFYAYSLLMKSGEIKTGDKINFTVPTGNFGNILAGYYAKAMGLPIDKLICASNDNKVLYDFFNTGKYDINRKFIITVSPSMDILISSNLERLLYHMCNDSSKINELMNALADKGSYELDIKNNTFAAEYASVEETFEAIREKQSECSYVLDTHTAVAYSSMKKYCKRTGDKTINVVVSTASPYKFAKDVLRAIDSKYNDIEPFEALYALSLLQGQPVPCSIDGIERREQLHKTVIDKVDIEEFVEKCLK